jgi:tetratricopeptide (TPR) repeat protein
MSMTPLPSSHAHGMEDAVSLRQFALAEAREGRYDTAIATFTLVLDHHPLSAVDYNNRGLVYFQMGHPQKAIADFNCALALNPNLDSAYNNRANYHAARKEFLEAILDYDMAIELNPSNVRAWVNQGITFRDMGMYEHALENFDVALHLAANDRTLLGHIYAERGRVHHLHGDWNCAIADYNRAIAHLPKPMPPFNTTSLRLRVQVEVWLDDLLAPLQQSG